MSGPSGNTFSLSSAIIARALLTQVAKARSWRSCAIVKLQIFSQTWSEKPYLVDHIVYPNQSLRICIAITDRKNKRQLERTGRNGTPRLQYLQELVGQFQNSTEEESKERIVANLANFAYDPYNYTFLRQLNVLELFLDCITEPNEKLVEFGVGGICNACADPANAAIICQCDGIPLIIQCLSSPVTNTVNYALGSLYYLCNPGTKEKILKPEVIQVIERYAAAGAVSISFSNLAKAFLDKHICGQI